ncbi:ferredoxin reductase [Rhodococcus opacus]|uniref:ferredoxin reductase n=1 Tax=Rhodococcus opacus TaxID=37919 RepID=UPI0006BB51A3|nr:ferredoxin reductase [Rhodococcus opacus]
MTSELLGRAVLSWRVAELVESWPETASARALVLEVPDWPGHRAGQHVDLRLTGPDGYTTERSYSLASPAERSPGGWRLQLVVQRVADGEVSPYLTDVFGAGNLIEVRGPIGGWFVWSPREGGGAPVLLVAGGSGIVPLMSMIRERRFRHDRTPFRLVYSLRTQADELFADELNRPGSGDGGVETFVLCTREDSPRRPAGRITAADLAAWGWPADFAPRCFVCGPTGFVEEAARLLLSLGHSPDDIKTERFGPSGP